MFSGMMIIFIIEKVQNKLSNNEKSCHYFAPDGDIFPVWSALR